MAALSTVLAFALAVVLAMWMITLLAFARPLAARWREPILRHPVLIIESDDWGAGPLAQANLLGRLTALLHRVRDCQGRSAIMTLGVVLEVPDGEHIAVTDCTQYYPLSFTAARFDAVRTAMQDGIQAGVFVPQLHGQCHYWPPAVQAAAQTDNSVRDWLIASEPATSEDLPSYLQSRWVDASTLPSRALAPEAIQRTATAEASAYQAIFGSAPQVAVATTFIWNDAVETAWAESGVEVIITPGRRCRCRNAAGQPDCVDNTMLTGDRSVAGQIYLVRDVYFEPALGHVPQRLSDGLLTRSRQGRACLVETHRFNFLQAPDTSLATLEAGLNAALAASPDLRFLSPLELVSKIQTRDPAWIETRLIPHLAIWCTRLDEIPRFRRMAQLSGLALPLALLERIA